MVLFPMTSNANNAKTQNLNESRMSSEWNIL